MSSRSRGSVYLRRHHLHAVLALAALLAAFTGVADAVDVRVTVQAHGSPPPSLWTCGGGNSQYEICVDQYTVPTVAGQGGDVEVQWRLQTAGWAFDSQKCIEIYDPTPNNWKPKCGPPADHSSAHNSKKDGVKYKYRINLVKDGMPLQWDPFIMN
jgi:hypothetical protein